jgi:hypothetical protein
MTIAHKLASIHMQNNWQNAESHKQQRHEMKAIRSHSHCYAFTLQQPKYPFFVRVFLIISSAKGMKLLSYYGTLIHACNWVYNINLYLYL